MLLKDQVAFITGGANGMGKGIASMYAEHGAHVILADINDVQLKQTKQEIGEQSHVYGTVDITDFQRVEQVVSEVIADFGQIDILVNCAGGVLAAEGTSENINMDDWQATIDLNLTGTMNVIRAVLPHMKQKQSGKIINFSSMGAFNPYSVVLHYHAAKGGIESLTKNLAFELAPKNIQVNVIAPGPILTPFWDNVMPPGPERDALTDAIGKKEVPMGRIGTAKDIAGVALFLGSSLSDFVTGEKINVGGGMGNIVSQQSTFLSSSDNPVINK